MLDFLRQLYHRFDEHALSDVAAQLAFYAIFSLFPFIIFLATVIAYLPLGNTYLTLLDLLSRFAPSEVMPLLQGPIAAVSQRRGSLLLFAIALSIYSASSGTMNIITALNRAYRCPERRSWFWRRFVLAPAVTLAVAGLIIVGMVALLVGPVIGETLGRWLHMGPVFKLGWQALRWLIVVSMPFAALTISFALLPARRGEKRIVTPGSVIATLLWIAVSIGFRFYVARIGKFDATFGGLAAGAVLLLWLHLSSLTVLLGGEINAIVAHRRGHVGPSKQDEEEEPSVEVPVSEA